MDIIDCLRKAIGRNIRQIERRGVSIRDECGDMKLDVDVAPDFLQEACASLIENAVRNNRPNGKIILDLLDEEAYKGIIISDTGWGMTQQELNQVKQGNGLTGLFPDLEMLKKITGEFLIESQKNVGTQIILRWPK